MILGIGKEDIMSGAKLTAGGGLMLFGGASIVTSYALTGVTVLAALSQRRLPTGSEIHGWDSALEPIGKKLIETGEDWLEG